jgi:hypothetical protein
MERHTRSVFLKRYNGGDFIEWPNRAFPSSHKNRVTAETRLLTFYCLCRRAKIGFPKLGGWLYRRYPIEDNAIAHAIGRFYPPWIVGWVHGQPEYNAASSLPGTVTTPGVCSCSSSAAMSSWTKRHSLLESLSFSTAAHSSRQSFRLRSDMFCLRCSQSSISRLAATKLSHFHGETGR